VFVGRAKFARRFWRAHRVHAVFDVWWRWCGINKDKLIRKKTRRYRSWNLSRRSNGLKGFEPESTPSRRGELKKTKEEISEPFLQWGPSRCGIRETWTKVVEEIHQRLPKDFVGSRVRRSRNERKNAALGRETRSSK